MKTLLKGICLLLLLVSMSGCLIGWYDDGWGGRGGHGGGHGSGGHRGGGGDHDGRR